MKNILKIIVLILAFISPVVTFGAPPYTFTNTLQPSSSIIDVGSTTLSAYRNIVAQWFTATSTTATSTFAGSFIVNGNTLFVDADKGLVGIGTSTPIAKLDVRGDLAVTATSSGISNVIAIRNLNNLDRARLNYDSQNIALKFNYPVTNTDLLTIDMNGNTSGFGTSTPYSTLSVTNTQGNPSFVVEDSTSPDTTPFIIDASGNVGIASSTPGAKLSIFTSSDVNNTYIDSSSNNNFALTVRNAGGIGKGLTVNVGNTGSDATIISANNLSGTNFFTVSDGNSYFQNGNVGIGSTSPYASLSITNTGTNPSFVVEDSTSPDTTPFIIDASGNVGIGTTSPFAKLALTANGNSLGTAFQIANSSNITKFTVQDNGQVGIGNLGPASNVTLHVGGGNSATILDGAGSVFTSQILNSQTTGVSGFTAYINDGTNNRRAGLFVDQTNAIWGLSHTASSGEIPFVIRNVTAGEMIRLTTTGNFGIATTSPYSQLSIGGNSVSKTLFALDALSGQTQPILDVKLASTTKFIVDSSGNVGVGTTSPNALLAINPNGISTNVFVVASSTANKFVITNGGNVGISVSNPGSGLLVNTTGLIGNASTLAGNIDIGAGRMAVGSALYSYGGICASAGTVACAGAGGVVIGTTNATAFTNFPLTGNSFVGSKFGVGSSSPFATLSIVNSRTTAGDTPLLIVASTTNGTATTTFMVINPNGNVGIGTTTPNSTLVINGTITSTSTPPAITSCGTGPTVIGNNNWGEITVGTTASGCTATFATPYPVFASCVITNQSMSLINAMSYSVTKTGFTVTQTGLDGLKLNYKCDGY